LLKPPIGEISMPQHKSAEKRVKTNSRDQARNVASRSRFRKAVTAYRAVQAGDEATRTLPDTVSEIDVALKKGIIPRNRANRLKSRLARRRNRLAAGAKTG
jgi:small subunit ribosomal protein S20